MTTTDLPSPVGSEVPAARDGVSAPVAVAVCIPARNEERTISEVVRTSLAAFDPPEAGEVIVVDDGCTDRTAALAAAAGARVVDGAAHGKGGAMRRAIAATTAEIIVFADADLTSLKASDIDDLARPLIHNQEAPLTQPRGGWTFRGSV